MINKSGGFNFVSKKGVSAVVATVLIVLITVAAVAVIWGVVIPMVSDSLVDIDCSGVDVTIDSTTGYSCFDPAVDDLGVRVKKGAADVEVKKVDIIYSIDGNSKIVRFDFGSAMDLNSFKALKIAGLTGKPDSVRVVPYVSEAGQEKVCPASSSISVVSDCVGAVSGEEGEAPCVLGETRACEADNLLCTNDIETCLSDETWGSCEFSLNAVLGTVCSDNNGKVCDGSGVCVECNADSDCSTGMFCSANLCEFESSVVAMYDFEQNVLDQTGKGYDHGQLFGDAAYSSLGEGRIGNYSIEFDGDGDYIFSSNFPSKSFNLINPNVSVSYWMKTSDASGDNAVATFDHYFVFYAINSKAGATFTGFGTDVVYSNTSVDDDVWHNVVLTYDGVTQKVYIDGFFENSRLGSVGAPNTNELGIGGNIGSDRQDTFYNGSLDDFIVWNRVLSDAEIATIFSSASSA